MRKNSGYTLIELSVVIMILGVLVGGGVQLYQKRSESLKIQETTQKMQAIDAALQEFYRMYGYLPCPAPGNATSREPVQHTVAGDKTSDDPEKSADTDGNFFAGDGVPYDKDEHRCASPQGKTGQLGTVPTRTLNMADEMMFDAWGRKIGFRLAEGMGSKEDFATDTFRGDVSVEDENEAELTALTEENKQGAAYVIISYGLNGMYGWQRNGEMRTKSLMPLPELEEENGPDDDTVFRQAPRGSDFDDVVLFRTKGDVMRPRRLVQPITIPDFICERAATIMSQGLGAHGESEKERTLIYIETARAIDSLCKSGAPPLEQKCGLNLAWLEDKDEEEEDKEEEETASDPAAITPVAAAPAVSTSTTETGIKGDDEEKNFSCRCLKKKQKYRTSLSLDKFGLCLEE